MNSHKTINGKQFYDALVSGISNVISRHEYLNKINVFPVPDGDTGTNLLFTLRPITLIERHEIPDNFGDTLKKISDLAIDSARGNSGTIIAQYFVGMAESSENVLELDLISISKVFKAGYEAAFSSMSEPKEGTIISIMKEAALTAENNISNHNIISILKKIYESSINALKKTPDQMQLLKDAGVVDAGAQGYVDLLEGIVYFMENNQMMNHDIIKDLLIENPKVELNIENYTKSDFQFCTECIINNNKIDRKKIKQELNDLGDSLIIAGTKSKVKIHIHTNDPNLVFKKCQSYGQITNQKADDMFKQIESSHNNDASIAIVTDSGCDIAINPHNSNIHTVHVRYSFGSKDYIDKISQTPEEFYNELQTNPIHPKTSQPAIGDFLNKFQYLSSHYESAISIHIPGKLSGTIQACKNAINKIKDFKITPIDSLSASVGLGLIVKSASEIASEVNNHDEIIKKINQLIDDTEIFIAVKNLNYAIRGGRVPKLIGEIIKFLNIKPVLTTSNKGNLKLAGAFWGSNNLHIKMGNFILKKLDKNHHYKLSIAHSNSEAKGIELVDYIQNNFDNIDDIDLVDMGSALGVHAGPGAFGVGCQKVDNG